MSAKTIKYSQRLGDVLRCLPAAKHLADQGHEVFFDCFPQYHGVFDLVHYVTDGSKGDVLDLEIWPNKYEAYRKSRKTWTEFVYAHPDIKGAEAKNIVLDKLGEERVSGLPDQYHLIAPFGISQGYRRNPLELIQDAAKQLGKDKIVILCPPEFQIQGLQTFTAPSVEQMAKAIRDAEEFWCINSAPVVIASAVRRGKETRFWGVKNEWEVDNIFEFDGLLRMD